MVHIEAHADEDSDEHVPRNLHNAAELFLKKGKLLAVKRLQECTMSFFKLVELQPKADTINVGHACICWTCGHCGLQREDGRATSQNKPGRCINCGDEQTNYLQCIPSNGGAAPWIELVAPKSTEDSVADSEVDKAMESL